MAGVPNPPAQNQPGTSFHSVVDLWMHRVRSTPDSEAMTYRDGEGWSSMTWRQADVRVRRLANGLLSDGLTAEQRVCILADTSVAWILADLAILCAGGATTTIYPSNTPKECAYIIQDCGAVAVFVQDDLQAQKLVQIREQIPQVRQVYVFHGVASPDGWVQPLSTLESRGDIFAASHPDRLAEVSAAVGPERLATLIYTSGTTGVPKGVMITHDSWVFETDAIEATGFIGPADRQLLFLPLAHVFAKIMQVIFIRIGVPTVVDGDINRLLPNMAAQRPTWMGAVPRVFEKAYARITNQAREAGGLKWQIFQWAVGVGRQVSRLRQARQEPRGWLALQFQLADRLVFSKVKAVFGGRLRFMVSGGAPLATEIAEFFHACDILILEGYGMTESTGATCINTPTDYQFGTVGRPIPGASVRIADDGEILIGGRGVMRGYYNLPEKTAETLEGGWLHTGDLGAVLPTGHVQVTGRKKDLIITAGGKNIGPEHFQNKLKSASPWVSQVLMHGDRRPYCVAIVTLNTDNLTKWASERGVPFAELARHPDVRAMVQADVDRVNRDLPSYETVKKVHICEEDWTVENGFLTPSMKVKRQLVEQRYADELNKLYEGGRE